MAGPLPLRPEVVARLDQAHAEVVLPEAVDRHPGHERVAGVHQPARQAEPVGRLALGDAGEALRHVGGDDLPLAPEVAPHQDVGLPRLLLLLHHHRRGDGPVDRPLGLAQGGQLVAEGPDLGRERAPVILADLLHLGLGPLRLGRLQEGRDLRRRHQVQRGGLGRRERQAEPADDVLGEAGLELEADFQGRARLEAEGGIRHEDGPAIDALLVAGDGPARFRVAVDRLADVIALLVLRVIGLGAGEDDLAGRLGPARGEGLDLEAGEDEIAVLAPGRPLVREALVGQGLQAERRDRLRRGLGRHFEDVGVGVGAPGEHRVVVELRQHRVVLRDELGGLEHLPPEGRVPCESRPGRAPTAPARRRPRGAGPSAGRRAWRLARGPPSAWRPARRWGPSAGARATP